MFKDEELKGHMTLDEFNDLVTYIQKNHSFPEMEGKRIKYITPTFDTRTGRIFHINLRLAGEGKDFSVTNENKHRKLNEWVVDWLDNGER